MGLGENGGGHEDLPKPDKESEYKFTTSPSLEKLSKLLISVPFDQEEVFRRVVESNAGKKKKPTLSNLPGILAETYVNLIIEQSEGNPELELELSPIPQCKETNNFRFIKKKRGRTIAVRKEKVDGVTQSAVEYDQVLIADTNLPVVVEVKSSKRRTDINRAQKPEVVKKVFTPLREVFDTDTFGYLLVGFQKPGGRESTRSGSVTTSDKGIISVILPMTSEELQGHAEVLLEQISGQNPN